MGGNVHAGSSSLGNGVSARSKPLPVVPESFLVASNKLGHARARTLQHGLNKQKRWAEFHKQKKKQLRNPLLG
jgi:hypothetical protein